MRCAIFFAAVSLGAAQTFPTGVAPLLSRFRVVMDRAGGGDEEAVASLTNAAAAELARDVARDQDSHSIAEAASAAAARNVQYLKYVGSCVRLSEGCLVNWATGAAGDCVPPAGYDGPCGATDVSQLSGAEQEEFALRCQAPWPCRDCKTDFEGCPSGWAAVGRLCVAPTEYDGMSPISLRRQLRPRRVGQLCVPLVGRARPSESGQHVHQREPVLACFLLRLLCGSVCAWFRYFWFGAFFLLFLANSFQCSTLPFVCLRRSSVESACFIN